MMRVLKPDNSQNALRKESRFTSALSPIRFLIRFFDLVIAAGVLLKMMLNS